jgi:cell wall-associated NlpC family hydrolase
MSRRTRLCTPALVLAAALAGAPAAVAGPSGGVSPPVSVGNSPSGGVAVHGSGGPTGSGSGGPTGSSSSHPTVSGSRGVLKGGLAYAPAKAPAAVKAVIWAANKIRHKPYKWGGGHGRWDDTGYDCSGAVSFALHGAGLLDSPLDSRGFMRYGDAGTGRWITVYGSNGHAYMIVAGLRFDTSGRGESGPRWRPEPPWERNFTARHPRGL